MGACADGVRMEGVFHLGILHMCTSVICLWIKVETVEVEEERLELWWTLESSLHLTNDVLWFSASHNTHRISVSSSKRQD